MAEEQPHGSIATTLPVRTPTSAPRPARDQGSHPVDPAGVRNLSEENKPLPPKDESTLKKKKRTFPRSLAPRAEPLRSGVPSFSDVCSTAPIRYPVPACDNFFIPCFGMVFNILAAMTDAVAQLSDYGMYGTVHDWIPQSSFIVIAILCYIQTLVVMEATASISNDQLHFLKQFKDLFPLDSIEIPGPLVHIFRSISVASPGVFHSGDVSPVIPPLIFREQDLFAMRYRPFNDDESSPCFQGIQMLLPHIPLMIDQLMDLLHHVQGTTTIRMTGEEVHQLIRVQGWIIGGYIKASAAASNLHSLGTIYDDANHEYGITLKAKSAKEGDRKGDEPLKHPNE